MLRRVFYINLDRDADRRAAMEITLSGAGLPFERFPALTPATLPPAIAARFRADGVLQPGEIGCFASHLALLSRISDEAPGYYGLFEDDIALTGDFAALGRALAACPSSPEALRLENPPKTASLCVFAAEGFAFLRPLLIPNSSAGYLVTPDGARKILAHAWDVDMAYDQFLRVLGRADVDMLVCAPPPIRLLELESAIDPSRSRSKRRYAFRGSEFSVRRLAGFIARFGPVSLIRVLWSFLAMRRARVRLDRGLDYVVDLPRSARR